MKVIGVLITLCLNVFCVENIMVPFSYRQPDLVESVTFQGDYGNGKYYNNPYRVIGLRDLQKTTVRTYGIFDRDFKLPLEDKGEETTKKPCSMVVISDSLNSAMQSLLRKYRYDANGVLIPSSVKYFIKLPQGLGSSPLLIPLNGKAFSPLGGFVRYYKEVPPISPSL